MEAAMRGATVVERLRAVHLRMVDVVLGGEGLEGVAALAAGETGGVVAIVVPRPRLAAASCRRGEGGWVGGGVRQRGGRGGAAALRGRAGSRPHGRGAARRGGGGADRLGRRATRRRAAARRGRAVRRRAGVPAPRRGRLPHRGGG